MKSKLALGAIAALVTLGAANAQAARDDRPGWYGGLQLGRSELGTNGSQIDGALGNQGITSSTTMERHDTSWGGNVGYRISPYLSLEAGYAQLGEFRYNAAASAPGADNIQGNFKAHAWSFSPVGTIPLNDKWSLYGKAGLTRVSANLSAASSTGATSPSSQSDTRTGFLLGAGATYDFTQSMFGKLSWDRYSRVGNAATGNGSDNLLSVGVGMRF